MRPSVAILVIVIASIGAAQAPPQKPSRKTQTAHSSFVCPDTEAQKACKSYEELLKSRDRRLLADSYADASVCFRKDTDEFFLILFSRPHFPKRWDPDLQQMVVATESTRPGHGYARTYKDGVENSSAMPSLFFSGKWHPYSESGIFDSNRINSEKQDENDHDVGISIDETQINIRYKYTNTLQKIVRYNLTVQRSTGRFVERFQEQGDKVPSLENTGYCIYRKAE